MFLIAGKSSSSIGQKDFLSLPLAEEHGEWAQAFQCDYSDAGMFGFLVSCQAENATAHVNKLMESLKSLDVSLTEDHVTIARSSHMRGQLKDFQRKRAFLLLIFFEI